MGIGRHPGFKPYGEELGRRLSQALSNQAKEGLKPPNLTDLKTPAPISFLGRLSRQRGRYLLEEGGNVVNTGLGVCLGTDLAHTLLFVSSWFCFVFLPLDLLSSLQYAYMIRSRLAP
jgi:hypothetical protein